MMSAKTMSNISEGQLNVALAIACARDTFNHQMSTAAIKAICKHAKQLKRATILFLLSVIHIISL
jgi:hypothetical protein